MHPRIWKLIVNECLVYEQGHGDVPLPDFTKEQLVDCILELWAVIKCKERAAHSANEGQS